MISSENSAGGDSNILIEMPVSSDDVAQTLHASCRRDSEGGSRTFEDL